jgi:polyhydroxyalkanoate synthesis regulator phasin
MKTNKKLMTRIGAGVGITALSIGALAGVANATGSTHKGDNKGNGPVSSLVAVGTLTQEQATAVSDALKAAREASRTKHLGALVAAGTITQAQADSLADKGGMRELIQSGDMTREEAMALRDAVQSADKPDMDGQFESVLSKLVATGTITQSQADSISAARPTERFNGEKGQMGGKHGGPSGLSGFGKGTDSATSA